ncbi:MAG: hypothetical protein ACRCYX_07635, partial [Dermatophilaceae bacterium]
ITKSDWSIRRVNQGDAQSLACPARSWWVARGLSLGKVGGEGFGLWFRCSECGACRSWGGVVCGTRCP